MSRADISTRDCTWNPKKQTLTIEVSELEAFAGLSKRIMVQSEKTGRWLTFLVKETQRNLEGEVEAWIYTNSENQVKLVVLND